mmetsp:Transcript_28595/g.28976  ORF Transcript_28595/g.28976 Transcript_28595/m.28976 type:complete len:104 (-) Transcript_28595:142-453(-)
MFFSLILRFIIQMDHNTNQSGTQAMNNTLAESCQGWVLAGLSVVHACMSRDMVTVADRILQYEATTILYRHTVCLIQAIGYIMYLSKVETKVRPGAVYHNLNE